MVLQWMHLNFYLNQGVAKTIVNDTNIKALRSQCPLEPVTCLHGHTRIWPDPQ